MTWKHQPTFVKSKGVMRIECACGWHSERGKDPEPLLESYRVHTKLIEKQERGKSYDG